MPSDAAVVRYSLLVWLYQNDIEIFSVGSAKDELASRVEWHHEIIGLTINPALPLASVGINDPDVFVHFFRRLYFGQIRTHDALHQLPQATVSRYPNFRAVKLILFAPFFRFLRVRAYEFHHA